MDQTNFLPDHIMIDIFRHLTPKTIKNCSLVCKRWDDLISNSKVIMDKFALCIDRGKGKEATEVRRRHEVIIVKDFIIDSLDAIIQHNLQVLVLHEIQETVDSSLFINMLNRLPRLKRLLANIDITYYDEASEMKVRLDHLEILCCKIGILRIIDVKSLKNIVIHCDADLSCGFFNFLEQQKDLKWLTLAGACSYEFFRNPMIFKLDCRLSHFRVTYMGESDYYEEFIKFLQFQQESLKSLEIEGYGEAYEIVREFILKNLNDLKTLMLNFIEIEVHTGEPVQATLPVINIGKNLESLNCVIEDNVNINKIVFNAFPNLKSLEIGCILAYENTLKNNTYIGAAFKDLESLTIREIGTSEIYFPKLKFLKVSNVLEPKIFNAFIRRHSKTLEDVKISDHINVTISTVDELVQCSNLKHLTLESFVNSNCTLFIPILNELSQRSKFTLNLKLQNGIFPKKFIFPDDKIFWDDYCEQFLAKFISLLLNLMK